MVRLVQDTSYAEMQKPFHKLNNIFYAGQMLGDYGMILYQNARNPYELNTGIQLFRRNPGRRILKYDLLQRGLIGPLEADLGIDHGEDGVF